MRFFPALLFPLFVLNVLAQQPKTLKSIADIEKQIATLQEPKSYVVGYDKFKETSSIGVWIDVGWKNRILGVSSMRWLISSRYAGEGLTDQRSGMIFCIRTGSPSWRFLKNSNLIMLIDGEKDDFGEGRRDGTVNSSRYGSLVTEISCWELTDDRLKALAEAKRIESQYGPVEGVVREEKMPNFREYRDLLK